MITISNGNRKMGTIPSFFLPCGVTCRHDAPCKKECYARRIERLYKNTKDSYYHNLDEWIKNPKGVEKQIVGCAYFSKLFRWHVAGDIVDEKYLEMMIRVAQECNQTIFLAFTKKYEMINTYFETGNSLPDNLIIVFSVWKGLNFKNQYNLPVAHVLYKNGETTAPDGAKLCSGNCFDCAREDGGCWSLKNGEYVVFMKH